ncbi:MAG: SDR family oxidoreductase [Geminicoccaceae bacterium]|nr:SDR family oxidoreductase [Geminicoccaceae bacterium]
MRLKGKVAVVTGAGCGFGEGIATRYAAEGARVVVNDLKQDQAERVAGTIKRHNHDAIAVAGDVGEQADWQRLVQATRDAYGRLDILVNNAGTTYSNRPMLEVDEAEYDRVFRVNVKSIYWSAHAVVPLMREQGSGGSIINIASTAGLRPRPGLTWYNASKGAVITMSKSMAVELAPDKIRVNAICPVVGETGLTAMFMGGDTPELRAKFVGTIPMGRMSTPADIATAALYFADDEAAFITGTALEVDGGRCV